MWEGIVLMKAMYNRESKNVWIVHDDGSTEDLGQAQTHLEAYDLLGTAGFMRTSDWRLAAGRSPLREAEILRK